MQANALSFATGPPRPVPQGSPRAATIGYRFPIGKPLISPASSALPGFGAGRSIRREARGGGERARRETQWLCPSEPIAGMPADLHQEERSDT
jgi:hypothetical protein